jgi:IclR family acetate operon transcriptional repressor
VLLRLARRGVAEGDLVEMCRPAMERLGQHCGETIDLAVPVPGGREHYVAQVDGRHFVGTGSWVGRRLPHHCTSVGKVFLAFGARLAAGPMEEFTPETITNRERLTVELVDVRRRGYAISAGELEPGLMAVAAPLLDAGGRAVAAISISGPALRLDRERLAALGEHILRETTSLSERLGYDAATKGAA